MANSTRLCCLQVLPLLQRHSPNFHRDLVAYNFGWVGGEGQAGAPRGDNGGAPVKASFLLLATTHWRAMLSAELCCAMLCPTSSPACRLHYAKPGFHGEKLEDAPLYRGLSAIGAWRQANRGVRPQMVWFDTPVQVGAGCLHWC